MVLTPSVSCEITCSENVSTMQQPCNNNVMTLDFLKLFVYWTPQPTGHLERAALHWGKVPLPAVLALVTGRMGTSNERSLCYLVGSFQRLEEAAGGCGTAPAHPFPVVFPLPCEERLKEDSLLHQNISSGDFRRNESHSSESSNLCNREVLSGWQHSHPE